MLLYLTKLCLSCVLPWVLWNPMFSSKTEYVTHIYALFYKKVQISKFKKCYEFLIMIIHLAVGHERWYYDLGMGPSGMQPNMMGGLQPPNLFAAMQQRPNMMQNMGGNDTFQIGQQQPQPNQQSQQTSSQPPQHQQPQQHPAQPPQSLPQPQPQQSQAPPQPNGETPAPNAPNPTPTPTQQPTFNQESNQQQIHANANTQPNDTITTTSAQPATQGNQATRTVAFTTEMIQVLALFFSISKL